MASTPEPNRKMVATPDSPARMATTPEPRHVTVVTKTTGGGHSIQAPANAELVPGLIASVMDPSLMSVWAASIPRASALAITETFPLTSVLPFMAVAISRLWAAHCTPEASSVHEFAPEASSVHEYAPEVSPVQESAPEACPVHESAPVPPEMVASAAEPPEVVTSTAEPPEVLVPTFELNVCPVMATEAVH